MRTINVTGGYGGTVEADLSDLRGNLAGATVRATLVPEEGSPPAVGDSSWQTVTGGDTGLVSIAADGYAAGHYWLAVDVQRGSRHELVWATDADRPGRRALVYLI